MLKIKYALAAGATFMALAGAAHAATDSGVIRSEDSARHMIVLSDGTTYQVGSSVDLDAVPVGQTAVIAYDEVGGRRIATSLQPMGPSINNDPTLDEEPSPGDQNEAGPAGDQPQPE